MKKYTKIPVYIIIALFLFPVHVFSASITIQSTSEALHVGDQIVIKVLLDTEKLNINTIDGEIYISDTANAFLIKEINTATSKFTLWPRTPSLSADRKTISFVGGIPGGINGDNLLVLNIVVEALRPGKVVINEKNIIVLLNDGKGTSVKPIFASKTINIEAGNGNTVLKDEWSSVVSTDTVPPKKFKIEPGSDESLFDGRKFISFNTTDGESGVDYYIVTEGSLPPVRSGSTYVLQNQNALDIITVAAFDNAGNVTVSKFNPVESNIGIMVAIVLTVVILPCTSLWFLSKKRKYALQ